VEANHRAVSGDEKAGVRPAEFADSLPIAVLTCFDPRLHALMPEVLGVPEAEFVWVTNAGNVVTGPLSSSVRSLALACAVHDVKEIAIIGHTDCRFFQPTTYFLASRLRGLGASLGGVAAKLDEFLHKLVDERSNVNLAVKFVRESSLIDKKLPVHGLMVELSSGRLDWVVNGYQPARAATAKPGLGTCPPGAPPLAPPPAPGPTVGGEFPPIGTF
jgi:carbonic anhydrase